MVGEKVRLRSVMVSLVKNAMARSLGSPVNMVVAYCEKTEILHVQVIDEGPSLPEETLVRLRKILDTEDVIQQCDYFSDDNGEN